MTAVPAFDAVAADYDRAFTETPIGRRMRAAVWRRLDAVYGPGDRVLELNCGTGEDAVHLARRGVRVLATDAAPAMVDVASRKVRAAGVEGLVRVAPLAIEQVSDALGCFDGVLSNFGGLNCVADLPRAAAGIASCVRPSGVVVLVVMGPTVPWEWAWFLGHGAPGRAFRRLGRGGVAWRGTRIRYPSIRALRHAFAPHCRLERVAAVGGLLPPPFANAWASRHPRLTARLDRAERALETMWPLPGLADHYLAELRRSPRAVGRAGLDAGGGLARRRPEGAEEAR